MACTTSVLFLCTHNSARSQMAEAILHHLDEEISKQQQQPQPHRFRVLSAGSEVTFVRPLAIECMKEWAIDLSSHKSKHLNEFLDQEIDFVVTVCDAANDSCPCFPHAKTRLHWSLPDPSKASGSKEEQLQVYRDVRDAIKERIVQQFFESR